MNTFIFKSYFQNAAECWNILDLWLLIPAKKLFCVSPNDHFSKCTGSGYLVIWVLEAGELR